MNFRHNRLTGISYSILALALLSLGGAQAQTLTKTSGDGQIVPSGAIAPAQLVVTLLDATGKPFPNQTITFTTAVFGGASQQTAFTDVNGQASVFFTGQPANFFGSFTTSQVVATYGVLSTTFNEISVATAPTGAPLASASFLPSQSVVVTGAAGSTGTTLIQAQVMANQTPGAPGGPIPGVGVTITATSANGATLSCKEGPIVFTDSTGTATCTPLFGKIGSGTFTINAGGAFQSFPIQFQVTVGPPALVSVTSGNNQSGAAGAVLSAPLVATVTDLGGNPLTGVTMVFSSVTPGAVTLINTRTVSDSNGRISTGAMLGSQAGTFQISVKDAANLIATPAVFTVTVNVVVTGITKIGGDQQNAIVNSAFSQPLTVQVNNGAAPASGVGVTFAVTQGSATVSTPTATTGANGQASTSVTAGGTAGPVTITATIAGFSTTFTLTVNPPGPTNLTFFNGASGVANSMSPGSVVTIRGSGISTTVQGAVGAPIFGPLAFQVAGVTVSFGGVPAPIYNVSNFNGAQSVTVQVPFEVPPGNVPVTITVAGGGSATVQANVQAVSPGIFEAVNADNVRRGVALHGNGVLVTASTPATRGETIRVYLTGLGPVSPAVGTNQFAPIDTVSNVVNPIIPGVNNLGAALVSATYARDLIGVYEVTITIPSDPSAAPSGSLTLSFGVQGPNGVVYTQGSLIAIQ